MEQNDVYIKEREREKEKEREKERERERERESLSSREKVLAIWREFGI